LLGVIMPLSADAKRLSPALLLATLGVVFGDIGTSPLYAFKEAMAAKPADAAAQTYVFGVLSLMFWAVTLTVSVKYVLVMLRFNYRGEGGVLALLSLVSGQFADKPRTLFWVTLMGTFAVSLFFGDAVITPAISVLSAVEGLKVISPQAGPLVVPLALVILVALFMVQRRGTAVVGKLFGPVMLVWFGSLAVLGCISIAQTPAVLQALSPHYALWFAGQSPGLVLMVVAAVFLCLTGAEALYADMGHFGRRPVQWVWFVAVFPALMLNYFGQGALVLRDPTAVANPFYLLAPTALQLPLVILATLATVIASQAVITGAFSAAQQASRLNLLPRLPVRYTSDTSQGQIYIPVVNWLLLAVVLLLVIGFKSSGALAAAYGIAVSGDLLLSSCLVLVYLSVNKSLRVRLLTALFMVMVVVEAIYFASNASKIHEGGWFPLLLALLLLAVMTTWRRGMEGLRRKKDMMEQGSDMALSMPFDEAKVVEGAAVFFTASPRGFPTAFLHNLKHNKVLHKTTVFMSVIFEDAPRIDDSQRVTIERGSNGIIRVVAHFGFREQAETALVFKCLQQQGVAMVLDETSFFISKPTVMKGPVMGLARWRDGLFAWMLRNSAPVARYFGLPPNRVVELGAQVQL
jgi:KUP system potassium uptake protein